MKKFTVLTLLLAATLAQAQSPASKKELVARILVLQEPAIEQAGQSLVVRPALRMQQQAGLVQQTRIAPEKRDAVAKQVQADLKKYIDDVGPTVRQQAVKLAPSTIGVLLEEKFSADELKQLIAIIESPVNKKYAQMSGDFQRVLSEKLVPQTQASVEPKVKTLEESIALHLGIPPSPGASPSAPAAKTPKK